MTKSDSLGARFKNGTIVPLEPLVTFAGRLVDEILDQTLDGNLDTIPSSSSITHTSDGFDVSRAAFKHLTKSNLIDYAAAAITRRVPTFHGVRVYVPGSIYRRVEDQGLTGA